MSLFAFMARVRTRRFIAALLYGGAIAGSSIPAFALTPNDSTSAQTTGSARLTGIVKDAQNKPVSGALVQLLDPSGNNLAQTTTNGDGTFRIDSLPPGHFSLMAAKDDVDLGSMEIDVAAGETRKVELADAKLLSVVTVTARLERARNALSPTTGSSQYVFDNTAIKALPQGDATPLNQVLLQAPGVVNDSLGQLHIRGDHADLQYRVNGIILPEGIATFGQTIDTRLAQKIDLLTGALPAQYGYRTAGVVDITTKQNFQGGVVDLYGGSHRTINPSIEAGTTQGPFSAYFSGSYLSSTLGIEPPTPGTNPIHDRTTQGKGFGYLSYLLGENLRLSGMFGVAVNRFEIPNNPDQQPNADAIQVLQNVGIDTSSIDSSTLNARQFERTNYELVALQGVAGDDIDYQFAVFNRLSAVEYQPDPLGDLVFNDDSSIIKRKSSTNGVQGDLKIPLGDTHTLRSGLSASTEDDRADNRATVFFPTDSSCPSPGDSGYCLSGAAPVTIVDNNPKNGNTLLGLYVQDQWDLSDALTLNYGLRYDRLNAYVNAQQLSPRLGLVWSATKQTTVHAAYARYFTPPPNELVSNSSLSKFVGTSNEQSLTNSPVQPERDHYFDLGVTQQFTPAFTVGLDGYYKYARNLLDEGQFGSALIFTPFNYGTGHIYGIELSSNYHRNNWSAYLNLAHTIAQGTNVASGQFNFGPDELAFISQHYIYLDHDQHITASGGVSYLWRGTTLGTDFTLGDGLRNDGDGTIPNGGKEPWNMQVNVSAARPVHLGSFGELDLRVAAINVLDRTNQIHDGTGVGVGAAQYGPRAAVYFGIGKPF